MPHIENWPVEYGSELVIGNLNKSIAVCSLWSEREYVAGKVGIDNVAVIGNLYSHGPGIEGMVRNILANPSIRGIVIAGKDKSDTAETLLKFWQEGVTKTDIGWTVPLPPKINEKDLLPGVRTLDPGISENALQLLRANVEVIDMRGKPWEDVRSTVVGFEDKPAFAEPQLFPKLGSQVEVMRGEDVGFVFRGEHLYDTWLEVLRTIRQFGSEAGSRYSSKTQEVLNVMTILNDNIDDLLTWPQWVGASSENVSSYAQQLIQGVSIDAEDSYAYGERMRVRNGDQIAHVVQRLKANPTDRGVLVDLWDVDHDFFAENANPPCMTQVWFRVFQGQVCATFTYRSHDMFGAWVKNTVGDRLLQSHISNEIGLPLGATTINSLSAHIYDHNFLAIDAKLKEHPLRWKFQEDPRGNILINVDDGKIVVRHENRSGAITTLTGTSADTLYKQIWSRKLISMTDHAMYVGYELGRAEQVIFEGKSFNQDKA
jgi:thymidylate synthase